MNKEFNINFIGNRKTAFFVSAVFILATLISLLVRGGLNYGIDFTGGVSLIIPFPEDELSQARDKTEEILNDLNFNDYETKTLSDGESSMLQITVSQKDTDDPTQIRRSIVGQLNNTYPGIGDREISAEVVGSRVGQELRGNAVKAIILSLIVIIAYIAVRFKFAYALGAISALVHDIIIVIGVFSILDWEISLPIIAALLTVVGYSLNDTIVVFDRIRENLNEHKDKALSLSDTLNISINQTLSRTLITSLTTFVVVGAIFIVFLPTENVLKYFSAALMIGVISGTYSSIFVATPTLIYLNKKWPIEKK
ncbi:MAG: protein translocase subunit SecF [Fibrobacterota bacterium]